MRTVKISAQTLSLLLFISPCGFADNLQIAAGKDSAIEEILVVKRRESDYSIITEQAQKILEVPGSLGDPLMAVFSLPGVLAKSEGGPPAVRGSSPSDNRYMVDGAPAGYVFHAFSTSVFNENIIQDFALYSAGFGPSYSNAIGGVFDIKLRDPKHQRLTTKLDLSALRAGIFLESEINDNSAFYFSGRGSLLQYFLEEDTEEEGIRVQTAPQDTDYQFKYVYDLSSDNKLTLSANGATDLAEADFTDLSSEVMEDPDFAGDAKLKNNYQNIAASWRSLRESGAIFNLQLGQYVNTRDTVWGDKKYLFKMTSSDSYITSHYDFTLGDDHNLTLGTELHHIQYRYNARFIDYVCTETDSDCLFRRGNLIATANNISVNHTSFYLNDHWSISENLAVDIGGQSDYNDFTEETFYNPRLAASWQFAERWILSSSLGAYNRFPDIDKLFPEIGNPDLKSPSSNHFTLGLKQNLTDGWSWSTTVYYKTMTDLPLAMSAEQTPNYTNNIEGEAYGLDVFINKELTERWYGWLAISAAKSLRTNKLTNIETDYYLDTPLVLNWVMNYKLGEKWTIGGRFTAQTGHAYTPIIGAQKNPYYGDHVLPVYGEAFSENLPFYSRLDLRFKRDTAFWGYKGAWSLDILNALNRRNVTDRHLDYKKTHSPQDFQLEDEVGLGIIVAAGMSVTF
ncbi:MAG TPA: TonB-dependent receptor [Cellvibrio sp.]|nr:TonB-dependent receptor [Cellvibrio sp.]